MNPFLEKVKPVEENFYNFKELYSKAYNKNKVGPYTKVRIILANGAEFAGISFLHEFQRHCDNNDLRRQICAARRQEQQQQKRLASLKPADESILEHTIGYEQVAVDLTAILAQREPNRYVKQALDFALLEDFDHLYRFANLLEMEHGIKAEKLVGKYAEVMPGRPTIAEHRHPHDDIRRHITPADSIITKLGAHIITAAEQQTMNYYMNVGAFYSSDVGRKLFAEIAQIEEQHVSHYGSLLDTNCTWLEGWLMHEYTECYLYWSCAQDETDANVKALFEAHLKQEISHLHRVASLLKQYEGKDYKQVCGNGEFPEPLKFTDNIEYVRKVLAATVHNTTNLEDYDDVRNLPDNHRFFTNQSELIKAPTDAASHAVIKTYIAKNKSDYRFETKPHPIKELADRKKDNVTIARNK